MELLAVEFEFAHPGMVQPRGSAAARNSAITEAVRAVAAGHEATAGQIALAWVLAQGPRLGIPVIPIPGTRRVKRLEQNTAALGIRLTDADLAALDPLALDVAGARH